MLGTRPPPPSSLPLTTPGFHHNGLLVNTLVGAELRQELFPLGKDTRIGFVYVITGEQKDIPFLNYIYYGR